jgi:hypothetical protein
VVVAGGEVRMLDPGSYGLLTITKSISIQGHGYGEIAASTGGNNALTISAGPNDKINLRGLIIEGFGQGIHGIELITAGTLEIQDSVIRNFLGDGVRFGPSSNSSSLIVSNTRAIDNRGMGFDLFVPIVGTATGTFDHVISQNNGSGGLVSTGGFISGVTGAGIYTISDSVFSNNPDAGVRVGVGVGSGASVTVMIRDSVMANNSNEGVLVQNTGATVRITRSTITENRTGFSATGGGALISYGDNNVDGNTTDGAPTSTIGYHQGADIRTLTRSLHPEGTCFSRCRKESRP